MNRKVNDAFANNEAGLDSDVHDGMVLAPLVGQGSASHIF